MSLPVEDIAKAMAGTILWAQRQAEGPMIKEVEDHGDGSFTALVIPGDQRVLITIYVDDITDEEPA